MIAAVILAAGESKRMGRPKMALPWGRTTVLGQVLTTYRSAGVQEVLVVTGGWLLQRDGGPEGSVYQQARLFDEVRTRLRYLVDVGLGYLTLDRQSRTLSGGEVQRINLTTALGTSLVNTLFVLDEPSVGLHPRDLGRIVDVLAKLRDAGNTLLVVEHDAQVMLAADRIVDLGPGPGRAGGQVVFNGSPEELAGRGDSATAPGVALPRTSMSAFRPNRRRPVAVTAGYAGSSSMRWRSVSLG